MKASAHSMSELANAVEAARQFAREHPEWHQNESPTFPQAAVDYLRRAGLLAAPVASCHGGLGLDLGAGQTLALLTILKQIGYGDLSTGRLYEGHVNAFQLISLFGTPEQIRSAASDVCDHGRLFAVWNTDADDPVSMNPCRERYLIEGAKSFASGRDRVQRPLITAELPDGGRQLVLVPLESARISIERGWWDPIGMEASESVRVDFTRTRVDKTALIGGPDDYLRQPWFFGGAIRFAAVQLGGATALFDETRRHLQRADRTGDPYQRQRAGQVSVLIESGNHWLRGSADLLDSIGAERLADHSDQVVNYVFMARTAIEQICQDVLELCIRSVGAWGLARAGRFQQIVRDLTLYLRQPAPDAAVAGAGAYALESEGGIDQLWETGDRRESDGETE